MKKKSEKKTNPEIKIFIDWFFNAHEARGFGKYVVTAKDAKAVQRCLGTIALSELQTRAGRFFDDPDSWPAGDKSITAFAMKVNKYGAEITDTRGGVNYDDYK